MAVVSRPIEVRVGTGRILIGTPALLPPEQRRPYHQVAVLYRLFGSAGAVRQLQQVWRQLPLSGSHAAHLTPMELRDTIERAIIAQRIALVWLPPLFTGTIQIDRLPTSKTPPAGAGQRTQPRQRIDDLPAIEKVALAVQRSLDHVRGDTRRKLVELRQAIERLDERDVALIVGGFALLAVPVVGEALGAAILAWTCWEFGYEGIAFAYGLGAASRAAAEARTEADIDIAARRYAEAFEHLGKAFIAWLLIRLQVGGLRRAAADTAAVDTTAARTAATARTGEEASAPLHKPLAKPAKRQTGTTVLGHNPDYQALANKGGDRYFDIPTQQWDRITKGMTKDQIFDRFNKPFIDRTIARGDAIILSNSVTKVKPDSYLARELDYLFSKGYKPAKDGLSLIKPGRP
ncbi:hypothetical protein [Sphingomonas sp. Leaf343]|uniref:hypothetical protein n=1 Tax=Sphingomonas sp. Leaf343 TaxID=1736345 RepID=UPI0006F9EA1B|nr:hypothetical protein [Sphingomonas sp. Leaf343]KQR82114.1 hypothetical protein ASG07_10425 [Sphingomonas sp. Leaf343]